MKLKHPAFLKIGGFVGAQVLRYGLSSLDYKAAFYDPTIDPAHEDFYGRVLLVFWHEYILVPLAVRRHCHVTMLLSRHEDARILGNGVRLLGFDCVFGSTSRGGLAALREMVDAGETRHLAITPDGPRGPRRTMAQGAIFLASRLQMPLVLMGLGYDRPWRLRSWDRFAIPRPFSRARAVVSPRIHLPEDLDRAGVEHYRQQVERLLNRLTCEAEAWAESGTRKIDERQIFQQHAARQRRFDEPHGVPAPHGTLSTGILASRDKISA